MGDALLSSSQVNIPNINVDSILINGLNAAYFAAATIAVIVIVIAGYQFNSGSYDPAKVTMAKNAILYSVIGLIVVLLAFVITGFVAGRFK